MGEPRAQEVLAVPARAGIFLVLTVRDGSESAVGEVLGDIGGLTKAVGFREPEGLLSCVVGIGSALWDRLYGAPKPAGLHPFVLLAGPRHSAPATPGDLLIHLRATRLDLCFELARQLMIALADHVDVADETHGFRYFDQRDLLGFVDGTENPTGVDAVTAVTVGEEDPVFAGSSYVIVQKYLHNIPAWEALTVEEQERAFGRHKLSDIEFADADKPPNSHVALNTIEDEDGNERQIVRHNLPFGTVGDDEYGTYFIGYAAQPDVIEQMLRNMFLGNPPGTDDRILDFSTAVTGGLFFVPTLDFLEDPDGARELAMPEASPAAPAEDPRDGSLGIGTLKGKKL